MCLIRLTENKRKPLAISWMDYCFSVAVGTHLFQLIRNDATAILFLLANSTKNQTAGAVTRVLAKYQLRLTRQLGTDEK